MVITPIPEPDPAVECPFGAWATPVTSEVVVAAAVRLGEVRVDGTDVVWAEGRPGEGGRTQLVRRRADGGTDELLPEGRNARTAVHEYGGAAWWVRDGVVWFTDWADQRLYRLEPGSAPVAAHPRAGPTARRPLRRRRGRPRRHPDRLRPRAAPRRPRHGRRQRDRGPRRAHARRAGGARHRPRLRRGPAALPGRRHAGLAAVEPPGDAVGRRRAGDPRPRDRRGDRGGRRAGRVGHGAAVAARRLAVVPLRPHGLVEPLPLAARRATSRPWSGPRPTSACPPGRSAPPATPCSTTGGWSWRAGATGSTAWRCAVATARSPTSTCPSPPSARSSPRARTRSSWWRAAPTAEPGVHRVDLSADRRYSRGSRRCGHRGTWAWPPTRSPCRRRCGSRPSTAPASRARPGRCSTRRSTRGSAVRKGSGRRCSS